MMETRNDKGISVAAAIPPLAKASGGVSLPHDFMKIQFRCGRCGSKKDIPDPIRIEFPCDCGGTLVLDKPLSQQIRRNFAQAAQVVPGESLMGFALSRIGQPKEMFKKWRVCVCPDCGKVRITLAEKFKCLRCGASHALRVNGDWHVRLYQTDDYADAQRKCREWSMKEIKHDRSL